MNPYILFMTPSIYCLSLGYLKITLHCRLHYIVSWSLLLVTKKLFFVFVFYAVIDGFVDTLIWLFLFWFYQVGVVKRRFIESSTENINCMSLFKTFFRFFVWTLSLFLCTVTSVKLVNVASFYQFILIRFFFQSIFIFIGRLILIFSIFSQIFNLSLSIIERFCSSPCWLESIIELISILFTSIATIILTNKLIIRHKFLIFVMSINFISCYSRVAIDPSWIL